MMVKVLITRKFVEGKAMEVFALLRQLRGQALDQVGYVTGETLIGHDDPLKILVIAAWQSVDNWIRWRDDPIRKADEARLQQYLVGPAKYEVFVSGTYPPRR